MLCAAWEQLLPACLPASSQPRSPWHCWKPALRSLFLAPLPSRLPSCGPWSWTERDAASRSRSMVQSPTLQRLPNRTFLSQNPSRCSALGGGPGKVDGAARQLSCCSAQCVQVTSRPRCCKGQAVLRAPRGTQRCRDENSISTQSSNPAPCLPAQPCRNRHSLAQTPVLPGWEPPSPAGVVLRLN